MDTVTLDGKVYVTAGKAADMVGYAPDYVGQLCRRGTLDGIMLGKTWYVREDSLLRHKTSKARVNTAATRRDIQKQQMKQRDISDTERFVETKIKYSSDDDDLLPSVAPQKIVQMHEDRPAIADVPDIQHDEEIQRVEESQPVPIWIASTARGVSVARAMHAVIDQRAQRAKKEPIKRTSRNTEISHRSILPVMSLLLILFILANIVLESMWSYTDTGSKQANLETSYNLASTASIMQTIRQIRF